MENPKISSEYKLALDGVRKTAGLLLGLAQVTRFVGAPFMKEAFAAGYINNVGSHAAECCQIWTMLRLIMPNFSGLVDPVRVYDILAHHDNGELIKGDISLHAKANGAQDDKDEEINTVITITNNLPIGVRGILVQDIRDFEAGDEVPVSLEIRIARLIDSYSGNIVALEKGVHLEDPVNNTAKILRMRIIPRTNQLIKILTAQNQTSAAGEIRGLIQHHLQEYIQRGVEINLSELE